LLAFPLLDNQQQGDKMSNKKSVLVVGLDPTLIDFSKPGYPPGMTADKVFAGIKSSEDELTRLGYDVRTCMTDFGETAEAVATQALRSRHLDCVVIGAGLREPRERLQLFERIINLVHLGAPQTRICFNTTPADTVDAVRR